MIRGPENANPEQTDSSFVTLINNDISKILNQMQHLSRYEVFKFVDDPQWNSIDFNCLNANQSTMVLDYPLPLIDIVLLITTLKLENKTIDSNLILINNLLSSNFLSDVNWLGEMKFHPIIYETNPLNEKEVDRIDLLVHLRKFSYSFNNLLCETFNQLTTEDLLKTRSNFPVSHNYILFEELIYNPSYITLFENNIFKRFKNSEINHLLKQKNIKTKCYNLEYYDCYLQILCNQLIEIDLEPQKKIAFIEKLFSIIDLTCFDLMNY